MTPKIPFKTAFTRKPDDIRKSSVVKFEKPNKVKKSLGYAVDIKNIYESYCRTGNIPLNGKQPIYDENFIKYDSLVEAQQLVKDACQYFEELPTEIKKNYGNDLGKFVKALNNKDQFLYDKGLLKHPEPVEVPEVQKPIQTPVTPVETPVNTATTDVV